MRSVCPSSWTLQKHAYSNIKKISPPKTENFQIKSSDIFHISAQNIDCRYSLEPPRRGGSNEYPHSMFLSNNKKNNVYPCKPKFYCIKVESFLGWVLLLGLFLYIVLTIGQRFPPMKMCPFSYIPLKITKKNILITWTRMFPLAKNKGNWLAWFMIFVILCVLCFQRASF